MAETTGLKIVVEIDGPYRVEGGVPLAKQIIEANAEGGSFEWREGDAFRAQNSYELCRCGQSHDKPYCDGSHEEVGFDGSETASRAAYLEQAQVFDGPLMELTDAESLCAYARFCDPHGQVWNLIEQTDSEEARELVRHEAGHCPAGRLVAWDKRAKQAFEPVFDPSIGLVEDPQMGVSGPIWVRGGIPVESADGTPYEVRNRLTLCRCGASNNKPFCDGTHASTGFKA
jgi:CDGSH-type Zn-finger protein